MSYTIVIPKPVQKQIDRLPNLVYSRIVEKFKQLEADPRPQGVVKLKNSDRYRIRIGNYRVIYEIDDDKLVVILVRCKHRKDAYTKS